MNPVYRLFVTSDSFAPTILRLLLALIFSVHGGQMTLGWMGGAGWNGTLTQWADPQGLHLSYALATVAIVTEVAGAVGMLLGFLTRPAALGILCVMAAAIRMVHWPEGFLAPKGYEYPLSLGAVALALIVCGGGRFSLDRWIARHLLPPNTGRLGSYHTSLG